MSWLRALARVLLAQATYDRHKLRERWVADRFGDAEFATAAGDGQPNRIGARIRPRAVVCRRAAEEVRLIGETGDLLTFRGGEIVKRDRLLLRQSGEMGKTALDAQADLTFYRLVQGLALLHQITPTMLRASVAAAHRTGLSSACPCVAML